MDYNSEKFKSALRELADKNIAMFNAADEATQDVTLLELREIILADSEERTPNIKDSTKKAQQEYASFLLQHVASLLAFAKENFEIDTIENAAVYLQSGWSKIVIVLGLFSKSLDAERIEQGYTDKTLSELLYEAELDDTGYPVPDSELYKLMVAAEQVKATPHVHASPIVKTLYPLDKMNSVTYGRSVEDYEKTLEINVASKKSDKAINVTYSVNFEALGASVSRSLSHFDKQVCIAAAAHYAAGNTVVSLSQIYTAMGNTGRPSQKQIAKIGESVDKLAKTEITIDNTEEAIAYKGRKKVVDKEMIIACKRRDAYINGHLTEGAIFMYDLPAPIRFARDRGQIIALDLKVLQSPMNKTEENLTLQDYLIRRISRKGDPRRILISTLLSKLGGQGPRQKKWRTLEKAKALLEYYKEIGFIADFKLEPDAICIEQPVKKRIPAASR